MQIVHDYRQLHAIPEPDRTLPKTVAYITGSLEKLNCRVFSPIEGAVCAFFDFGRPDCIAFRADMDGLPLQEETGLPWQSRHPGLMHACGHDGHCAILLELARRLDREKILPHNVLLLFQPAEETDGGAKDLCQTGILEQYHTRYIFGLHLWPGLPEGQLHSRPGVLMCCACGVTAEFTGRSAHIASYQQGQDALAAGCRFYALVQRLFLPRGQLIKFGLLHGGTAGNIVCHNAKLQGSIRAPEQKQLLRLQKSLKKCGKKAARQSGCKETVQFSQGYPAVKNHKLLLKQVKKIYPVTLLPRPLLTTEDFSFYQQWVPGVYFLLGVGDTPPLHSSRFSFHAEVLLRGADFFHRLALHRLL